MFFLLSFFSSLICLCVCTKISIILLFSNNNQIKSENKTGIRNKNERK